MANQATTQHMPAAATRRTTAVVQSLFFVAGFGTFIIGFLGLASTALGDLFFDARQVITLIGGVVMIVFGLFTMRIINIPILNRDTRRLLNPSSSKGVSGAQSYVTGLAFAAGWTPCIGPILGGIIGLASVSGTVIEGTALLVAYAAGLGLPFVLVAIGATSISGRLGWFRRNARLVSVLTGAMLIGVGFLMITNSFVRLSTLIPPFL